MLKKLQLFALICFASASILLSSVYAQPTEQQEGQPSEQTSNEQTSQPREQTHLAQASQPQKHSIFKDSSDGYFDMSEFIIHKKGFVPVPIIITEPSLGGFGFGLAPVFIHPNKPIERNGKMYPVAPDITAVTAMYTLNDTWGGGGGHFGYIDKWGGIKYNIGAGYADVNMDYYFDIPKFSIQDAKAEFNIKTVPMGMSFLKVLPDPRFSAGLSYMFMHNEVSMNTKADLGNYPRIEAIKKKIEEQTNGNVSKFKIRLDYDTRDNVFTPNKGLRAYLNTDISNTVLGSDYDYEVLDGEVFWYVPLRKNLTTGIRVQWEQSFGDQPFYMKPYVNMRGVPTVRYQGSTVMLLEVEERWDFVPRFSGLAFGGVGKGFDDFSKAASAEIAWSYGVGARYLLARLLNLRVGLDFAMGPEGPTWYIVFGSSWMRS